MQRTVSIKLNLPDEFSKYLETCALIFNEYVNWCFENKTYNKNKAHKELYEKYCLVYPDMPSGIIQSIRDMALESVKALKFKFKPFKKSTSHVRYDKRCIQLEKDMLKITWSGKRIKQKIVIPAYFKKRYHDFKFQSATIGFDKIKKCFKANLIFKGDDIEKSVERRTVGVDRGLYNIVTLSDGFKYKSNKIRKNKREVLFLKKQLQAKGTRSAKRKLKKLSGYEKRFSLNENHIISKQLVNMPYDVFVLEDLKGIRKQKSKGNKLNKILANWSFFQLEQLITYKADALGKQVVKINPKYTSQMCFSCKEINKNNRNGARYACQDCGYKQHADINAAKNILEKFTISAAASPKAEQAASLPKGKQRQSAKCLGPKGPEASHRPRTGGN